MGNVYVLLLYCCVTSTLICYSQSSDSPLMYSESSWVQEFRVHDYGFYGNVVPLSFEVRAQATQATWSFSGFSQEGCPTRKIHVWLQHGGLPVISPLNETFPPNFSLTRTGLHHLSLPSNTTTVTLTLKKPLSGYWMAVTFLEKEQEPEKILQNGFGGKTCLYTMDGGHWVEGLTTIPDLQLNQEYSITVFGGDAGLYRFYTSNNIWEYSVIIKNCTRATDGGDISGTVVCPLSVSARGLALPSQDSEGQRADCNVLDEGEDCVLSYPHPETEAWHYLQLHLVGNYTETVQLHLKILSKDSLNAQDRLMTDVDDISPVGFQQPESMASSSLSCLQMASLGRMSYPSSRYRVHYTLRDGNIPMNNILTVSFSVPLVLTFPLMFQIDTGSTLKLWLRLPITDINSTLHDVKVDSCIILGKIPVSQSGVSCPSERHLVITSNSNGSTVAQKYFPYPEAGTWYIAMLASCYKNYDNGSSYPVACDMTTVPVSFHLSTSACVDGGCGENGACRLSTGIYHFSTCLCIAKWRGYGCTDGTVADSKSLQLTAALLLSLSNLMFTPAVILAVYRRYYIQGLVYFYTMFFSSFYHACDGDRKYKYCLMPLAVLQFCDFFASVLSFWVTLVAMSRLGERQRSFMYVLAALGLAIGVSWDKHSLWTFLVPVGVALTVTLVTWCVQCRGRGECYPSRARWLLFILPGILCACVGLIMFAILQTDDNYRYTHSGWHACCAVAILFILPPRKHDKKVNFQEDVYYAWGPEKPDTVLTVSDPAVVPRIKAQDNKAFIPDEDFELQM